MRRPGYKSSCTDVDGTPIPLASGMDRVVSDREFPAWTPLDHDFDVLGDNTALAQSTTVWTTLCQFQVPDGMEGYLSHFGQDVDVCDAWQDIRWRIRVSGEVKILYPAVAQIATMTQDGLRRVHIFGSQGESFFLEVMNANPTARAVRGCIKGMYRPRVNQGAM